MSTMTTGRTDLCCIIEGSDMDEFMRRYYELNPQEFEGIGADEYEDEMRDRLTASGAFRQSKDAGKKDGELFCAEILNEDPYYDPVGFLSINEEIEYDYLELPLIVVYSDILLCTRYAIKEGFYSSKEELINEFRDKLGRYLPEDFDYETEIGDVYTVSTR